VTSIIYLLSDLLLLLLVELHQSLFLSQLILGLGHHSCELVLGDLWSLLAQLQPTSTVSISLSTQKQYKNISSQTESFLDRDR